VDREIGDLAGDRLADRPLLTYRRYNAPLEAGWLQEQLGLDIDKAEAEALVPMDNAKSIELLAEIGCLAAEKQVREEHFPACFDLAG
jgi:hypothetical protein